MDDAQRLLFGVIQDPPIAPHPRAGLSARTRHYLSTLRPGQKIDFARSRAWARIRPIAIRVSSSFTRSRSRVTHAARAVCGGSDGDDDSGGDGPGSSEPPLAEPPRSPQDPQHPTFRAVRPGNLTRQTGLSSPHQGRTVSSHQPGE